MRVRASFVTGSVSIFSLLVQGVADTRRSPSLGGRWHGEAVTDEGMASPKKGSEAAPRE